MGVLAIVLLLLTHNNLLNLWPPFNGWAYVPINLTLTGLLIATGVVGFGFSLRELGVTGPALAPALLGLAAAVMVTSPLLLLTTNPRSARWVADRRVEHLDARGVAYQVLVRIPLGTALLEEVAFRGVLFEAVRHHGDPWAAVASSIVFGLWHVGPTRNLVRVNRPAASPAFVIRGIVLAVLGTALAGLLFIWLRVQLDSLWAPWALHSGVNSLGTLAAVMAHRKLRATPGP